MWWNGANRCIDREFDEPDDAADRELCRAIVAGRSGLHPDGWGNGEPVPLFGSSRLPKLEPTYSPPVDRKQPEPRWRPPKPRPLPSASLPVWAAPPVYAGELELTCDECGRAAFSQTLRYTPGQREAMVAGLRALGRQHGWTCITGRDRCPRCSQLAAPEAKDDGAGQRKRDKQHANGG